MNAFSGKLLTALALSALSLSAFASASCTTEPKSKWMTEKDVQAKIEKQGYSVKRVKTEGNCYEVYAQDKDGKKVELIVNPIGGAVVKEEGKS